MQRHADEMKKDYDWNLFMGHLYALTFQDEKALPYLNQALKLYPKGGDTISKSDIREMIKGSKYKAAQNGRRHRRYRRIRFRG